MKTLLMILGITAILGAADGAALYKKCAACHGAHGEKKALGKSAVIKGIDTLADLKGYKAGTTNKAGMGALMKGQVASYSEADLEAVAAYIKAQ